MSGSRLGSRSPLRQKGRPLTDLRFVASTVLGAECVPGQSLPKSISWQQSGFPFIVMKTEAKDLIVIFH